MTPVAALGVVCPHLSWRSGQVIDRLGRSHYPYRLAKKPACSAHRSVSSQQATTAAGPDDTICWSSRSVGHIADVPRQLTSRSGLAEIPNPDLAVFQTFPLDSEDVCLSLRAAVPNEERDAPTAYCRSKQDLCVVRKGPPLVDPPIVASFSRHHSLVLSATRRSSLGDHLRLGSSRGLCPGLA